jgi:ubiquinol-cytochrome c reductase cytochrome c1 subunit
MKNILTLILILTLPAISLASGDVKHPKQVAWKFDGAFGTFDRASIQRGFQVYKEVCSACHSMSKIKFRNLTEVGFSEAEVKVLASSYTVTDGPNDDGEMFERPAFPSDGIPSPYANKKAAQAANGGAYPPDLSLIIKARHDGANYVYSLLTGYKNAPKKHEVPEGKYYNPYYSGGNIGMTPPLTTEGQITYTDGTKASVEQMAKDVVNFLQWTSEPEMEARKKMGVKVLAFLFVFTAFFFIAKKRVWARIGQ